MSSKENKDLSPYLFEEIKQKDVTIPIDEDDLLDFENKSEDTLLNNFESAQGNDLPNNFERHQGDDETTKTTKRQNPKRKQHMRHRVVTNFINPNIQLVRNACKNFNYELKNINILKSFGENVYENQKFFNSTTTDILGKNKHNKEILNNLYSNDTINYLSKISLKTIYEENYMKNSKKFKYSENENVFITMGSFQTFDEVLKNLEKKRKISEDDIPRFIKQSENLIRDIYLLKGGSIKPRKSRKQNSLNESDEI